MHVDDKLYVAIALQLLTLYSQDGAMHLPNFINFGVSLECQGEQNRGDPAYP
jgi:hypothetical protein